MKLEFETPEEFEKYFQPFKKLIDQSIKVLKIKTCFVKGNLALVGGTYRRTAETKEFIYFADWKNDDENSNVYMYRKSDGSLASNNYFASSDFQEILQEKKYTWLSRTMKAELKNW